MRFIIFSLLLFGCSTQKKESPTTPYVVVLGIAQDGGYPHAGCINICCKNLWKNKIVIFNNFLLFLLY